MEYEVEDKLPPADDLETINETISIIENCEGEVPEWFSTFAIDQKVRLAHDLSIVRKHFNSDHKLLDVGSLPLLFLGSAKRLDFDIIGLDIKPERFAGAIGKLSLTVEKCNIETEHFPFEDNYFDGLCFNEIFEHLRINPIKTLLECRRVLKSDGRIFLYTPNLFSFWKIIGALREGKIGPNIYRQYMRLEEVGHMGHVREFTANEIVEFLHNVGFVVEKVIYRGFFGNSEAKVGLGAKLANAITFFLPIFKPAFTIVARKPVATRKDK